MALNTFKCNYLTPHHFKGLMINALPRTRRVSASDMEFFPSSPGTQPLTGFLSLLMSYASWSSSPTPSANDNDNASACEKAMILTRPFGQNWINDITSIHRHQTPRRYRHVIHCRCCMVQPPPFSITPITAKHDVNHKTGSTQRSTTPPEEDWATATGDPHTKVFANRSSGSRDMLVDR